MIKLIQSDIYTEFLWIKRLHITNTNCNKLTSKCFVPAMHRTYSFYKAQGCCVHAFLWVRLSRWQVFSDIDCYAVAPFQLHRVHSVVESRKPVSDHRAPSSPSGPWYSRHIVTGSCWSTPSIWKKEQYGSAEVIPNFEVFMYCFKNQACQHSNKLCNMTRIHSNLRIYCCKPFRTKIQFWNLFLTLRMQFYPTCYNTACKKDWRI